MPDLSNDDQAHKLLESISPQLAEIKKLMDEMQVDPEIVVNIIKGVAINKEEEGAGYLQYPIINAGAKPIDILRGLYLLANIKRYARWGKVVFLMQDGRVVRVQQEQGYKLD